MSEFVEEYVDPIFKNGKPAAILFHPAKESALHDAFAETAKFYKGNEHKMIFVTATISHDGEDLPKMLGKFCNVKKMSDVPKIAIVKQPKKGSVDKMLKVFYEGIEENTSAEEMKKFV